MTQIELINQARYVQICTQNMISTKDTKNWVIAWNKERENTLKRLQTHTN